MKEETFTNIVKKNFGFLESTFGFKIILASNSEVRPQTDGLVKYASDITLVLIDSETGQAAVRFVRVQDDENDYLDPVSIHEFLSTSTKEKQLLLSTEPKDESAAHAIFKEKFLLASPNWKSSRDDLHKDLETRLRNYANWLRENADLCLVGDFSRWPELYEYKINRMIADELRRGGKAVVKAVIKDESGKLKMIERPIFQREKDHLEKLKREILGQ